MKTLFLSAALLVSFSWSTQSLAASVEDARLNASGDIEVDVIYGGGCKEHTFKLQVTHCLESMPVRCPVQLIDLTEGDFCEALISRTVTFKLSDYGFDEDYFSGATLIISGNDDSTATVVLPLKN